MNISNIPNIVSKILDSGLTQQELADLVPCAQSTINAYLKGRRGLRPSYEIGNRLHEIYRARCTNRNRRKDDIKEQA